jgi:hypothetical protein
MWVSVRRPNAKKKNLKIKTVIGHARKYLEDGNKIGAIESVRTDTDYSLLEAKTLVEFIERFTIVEGNATVASHWCEEHRIARFKCFSQHPEKLHIGVRSFIDSADTKRDDAAECKSLAEFTGSVNSCPEHRVQVFECARLHQRTEPQPLDPNPAEARPTVPLSVLQCACGNAGCDNQWHRLAMWIKDHPLEWQRALEELSGAPSQNSESAESLPD